ncbi:alpha/beta fold hydrolase [Rhodoluna limnophila]|uniref:alpha/beta fold hydrolase n=1 Tax=Rhodoluna limnophila TaxID=232537 RepID=UPI001106D1F9|nr:alpha/beta fold hydrolase [Rhodoluna limnophila]
MGDVTAFGGEPQIIATLLEIERVQACLGSAYSLLQQQLELPDFFQLPLKRIGLALEIGPVLERLEFLQQACAVAAQQYFDGEVQTASAFEDLDFAAIPAIAGVFAATSGQWAPYRDSQIKVEPTGLAAPVQSANSLAALLTRLERTASAGEPMVRIEKYSSAFGAAGPGTAGNWSSPGSFQAGNRYIVYIPGTQAWSPIAGKNPLDLTSNLQAMAGPKKASSEAAVQRAIVNAGVSKRDRVLLVGHSQGGMVAANLASQPQNYKVAGLVTIGSPISQLNQDIRVPTISLQHTNDLVPKLDLAQNALGKDWVTVEREAPVSSSNSKPAVLQAHELSTYRGTALLADQSTDAGLARIRELITDFASGQGQATNYRISR